MTTISEDYKGLSLTNSSLNELMYERSFENPLPNGDVPTKLVEPVEEEPVEDKSDDIDDELLRHGEFDTIRELREAAILYGRKHKFAVTTHRSSARQLVLVCKHSGEYRPARSKLNMMAELCRKNTRKKESQRINCPFEIRAKPYGGKWVIHKIQYEHNHEMAKEETVYAQHRKLTTEIKLKIINLIEAEKTNKEIKQILAEKGFENIQLREISNQRSTRKKQLEKEKASYTINNL